MERLQEFQPIIQSCLMRPAALHKSLTWLYHKGLLLVHVSYNNEQFHIHCEKRGQEELYTLYASENDDNHE